MRVKFLRNSSIPRIEFGLKALNFIAYINNSNARSQNLHIFLI